MNDVVVEKHVKMPKLSNAVLIEGLPGIGSVSKIAVDFMIDKLKAKKCVSIYSSGFPSLVYVNEDNTVELPKMEMFFYKNPKKTGRNIVFLTGDFQPQLNKSRLSYSLCGEVIKIAKSLGVKEIITLGGIGLENEPENPKVHCLSNDIKFLEKIKKKLKDTKVIFRSNNIVSVILGMAGLLLGIASIEGINSASFLSETSVALEHMGIKPAREIIKAVNIYLGLNYSTKDIDDEIASIEKLKIRAKKQGEFFSHDGENMRYIG